MTAAAAVVPLPFRIGRRTLWSASRPLARVAWSLDDVLAGRVVPLPTLSEGAQGWLVTSVPEAMLARLARPGYVAAVRQRYTRFYADFGGTYEGWLAGLSSNARSGLKRKIKKMAQRADLAIESFRTAEEMRDFHVRARPLAARTYQERLFGMGLPDDPAFLAEMATLAAADRARAWLMTLGERPIAYLWCGAEGESLRYDYVGHDPDFAELSPGTVLHARAFADLFAKRRFARFDFTEGEGRHKRQFASGGVACADVLLLRDTPANRLLLRALDVFDRGVALAKRAVKGRAA